MICERCGDTNATLNIEHERGAIEGYRATITCARSECGCISVVYKDSLSEILDTTISHISNQFNKILQ